MVSAGCDPTNEGEVSADLYVPVGEFFSERAVFITGGTGFLGKVLVEKLLRSCPGIKVIYLLMRPKRGLDLDARLAEIVNSPLFERLKKELPSAVNKIIPIHGDISEPDLGISLADQETLIQNVSVVFHSAATVKFDEHLRIALQINVLGSKRVVELCHKIHRLKALVHVSTCYSNCDLEEIHEVVYPPPYNPESILQCTEWMDDELLTKITPEIIGKRPNTYTFTKALTESYIVKEGRGLPIAIVRPAIITATWKEPMPGWVQGLNGPTSVIAAYGRGILRSVICDGEKVVDLIPADVVSNLMICTAWRTAMESSDAVTIYNCCTGPRNPTTLNQVFSSMRRIARSHPSERIMWYPSSRLYYMSKSFQRVRNTLQHFLPAYLIDCKDRISNKKPILVRVQEKIKKGVEAIGFFMLNQWTFNDDNTLKLSKSLSKEDQNVFFCDVDGLDWQNYMKNYIVGVRQYIHGEHPDTIPHSRVLLNRLLWMQRASHIFAMILLTQAVFYAYTCV